MKKLTFVTTIEASRQKVWNILWDNETYQQWTSVFSEGSKVETDWKEGSRILFLSGTEGMYSIIDKKDEPSYMSFTHLGVVKDGVELPIDEETKKWSGAKETYTLDESSSGTLLTVTVEITDDFESYFDDKFPKALEKVKSLAEK